MNKEYENYISQYDIKHWNYHDVAEYNASIH
jgi:hypothetical protein